MFRTHIEQEYDIFAYSDGACQNNEGYAGLAGSGVAFFARKHGKPDKFLFGAYLSLGICNSTFAEYFGVILAQTLLVISSEVGKPHFRTDFESIVKILHGEMNGKNSVFMIMEQIIRDLFKYFDEALIEHVRRNDNKVADALSKQAVKCNSGQEANKFNLVFIPPQIDVEFKPKSCKR